MDARWIFVFCLMIPGLGIPLHAQDLPPDTTIVLGGVEVTSTIPPHLMGVREGSVDSSLLSQHCGSDISAALQTVLPINLKTYGPGTVTTLSIRGTSASHSRVVWNGLPINSPTLGLTDLTNIPAFLADKVDVRFGGSGIGPSTGSMGGEIRMSTNADYRNNNSLMIFQQVGSIGQTSTAINGHQTKGKFHGNMRLYRNFSKNEFKYHDNSQVGPTYPLLKRNNAEALMQGGMSELYYQPTSKTLIRSGVWFHFADREIPSSLLVKEIDGNEIQSDQSVKIYASLKQILPRASLDAQIGYLGDNMQYVSHLAGLYSKYIVHGVTHELNYVRPLKTKHQFRIGEWLEYYAVDYSFLLPESPRITGGAYVSLLGEALPRFNYFLLIRQGFLNDEILPLTPSLGFEYRLLSSKPLSLRGNVSRSYRVPTLNDLYWSPGGDPNLDPEDGYQAEIGLNYRGRFEKWNLELDADAFVGRIDGWIQWLPHPEYNYWTVRNLRQVETKGLEASVDASGNIGLCITKIHLHYAYTGSIQAKTAFEGDATLGKQLIYVPMHSGAANIRMERKSLFGFVETPYVGKRYTNADNTRYMPSYLLVNAGMGVQKRWGDYLFGLSLECLNISNVDYQFIAWYPMPLRNYSLSIRIQRTES